MFMTFPGKADNGCPGRSTESNEILTHIQATSPGGFLLQTEGYASKGCSTKWVSKHNTD